MQYNHAFGQFHVTINHVVQNVFNYIMMKFVSYGSKYTKFINFDKKRSILLEFVEN